MTTNPGLHINRNLTILQVDRPSPRERPQCRLCTRRRRVSDITLGEVVTIDELRTLLEENPDDLDTSLRAIEGILLHFGAERLDASTVAEIIDCLERVFGLQM